MKPWRTPRDAPLVDVELAGAVRVEVVQRLLEARGHEQKLQVLLAARLQEVDHVLVLLDGSHDLVSAQRAAAVLVDHLEALARGVLEIVRKFLDLLIGLLGLELALGRPFRELVREGDLDALLPFVDVHVPIIVRVHRREGGLEARRDQQVLKIFIAAVDQKFDNFLVRLDSCDAAGESGGE